jgi:hypothetical protein
MTEPTKKVIPEIPGLGFRVPEGSAAQKFLHVLNTPGATKAWEAMVAKYAKQEVDVTNWRDSFRSVGQLPDGGVRMLLKGFLPEGINFIGALSGHGKSLLALSMVKSFTTGSPFLGKYEPEQIFPCLYLIPESSGRAWKMRCKAFGIPDDPNLFLCRTISEGPTLLLDDPILLKAVQELKPIVFLDTMIRFSYAKDENSAADNQALARDVKALQAAGAVAVVGLHHSTKAFATEEMKLENCLRGTGDIAALCDSVYALRRDENLYDRGNGPNEINVECVKPRDIKNPPLPFRLALTYKKDDGTLPSYIDETGDFRVVESFAVQLDRERKFIKIVTEDPDITREKLADGLGITEWALRGLAKKLGYARPPKSKNGQWQKLSAQAPEVVEEREELEFALKG